METPAPDTWILADSTHVAATPQQVYDVVSDVTRTGEWSVFTRACEWEDAEGPQVGARFVGHNSRPGRDWDTRSEVVAADPGREFAWEVNGLVRWGFEMEPEGDGTRLTHRWVLPPAARDVLRERFGDDGVELRTNDARTSIPATLASVRAVVERG
ncbi:SRPBCC family protein [Actinomycetospora cinnamomea]|uniref:SRPBCC family protein n=1 Tax=Actinomycetospora cinnamomea TaxID=663609 RepID=UPI001FAFBC2B|nr:SRPBCC family protein [Actinomycetospora cinnamomea]